MCFSVVFLRRFGTASACGECARRFRTCCRAGSECQRAVAAAACATHDSTNKEHAFPPARRRFRLTVVAQSSSLSIRQLHSHQPVRRTEKVCLTSASVVQVIIDSGMGGGMLGTPTISNGVCCLASLGKPSSTASVEALVLFVSS